LVYISLSRSSRNHRDEASACQGKLNGSSQAPDIGCDERAIVDPAKFLKRVLAKKEKSNV
jgi:hypothetical protein